MKLRSRFVVIMLAIVVAVGIAVVRGRPPRALTSPSAHGQPVVRPAAVAGTFYPAEASELEAAVQQYLSQVEPSASPGALVALIVPHAGYMYSASVAAHAYRLLEGRSYDTVIVIGPSHRVPFTGFALTEADAWATPLGRVQIDREAGDHLGADLPNARLLEAAHSVEHSIEVQLPFLQTVLEDFRLLPILMGDDSRESCSSLAWALAEYTRGRSVLLIASTDMSHYPSYDDAVRVDRQTLAAIETMEADRVAETTGRLLAENTPDLDTALCGEGPVKTVLMAARQLGADQARILRYANSGDVPGVPRTGVVGYCAVALYRSSGEDESAQPSAGNALNPAQQQRLLGVARAAIEQYVGSRRRLAVEENDPALVRPGAVFITLTRGGTMTSGGELRGCTGSLEPGAPLIETVRDQAIHTATQDFRFAPIQEAELPALEIEISVLSPLQLVSSAEEIDIQRHGIVVALGGRRGVFLPQVAQRTGWSRDVLLSRLCQDKAGLPEDAWRSGARLYVFTVQSLYSPAPREQTDEHP